MGTIDLERGGIQSGTYYLSLSSSAPTLHGPQSTCGSTSGDTDRTCLLNMRSSFLAGDTVKLVYELCEGGYGSLSFAANSDPPVQAFLMGPRTDYAPVALL